MSWLDAVLAYTHFVSIIFVASTLVVEAVLCRPGVTLVWARRLGRIDLLYLVAAVLVLASGLLRLFWGLKGSAFYTNNPVFWVKMGLFVAVGLISIIPTIRFIRWTKLLQSEEVQVISDRDLSGTLRIIYVELALLALIPLMAVLMARGFGYGG